MQLRIQQLCPLILIKTAPKLLRYGVKILFEKGELIKIVAPSGSGKSSLMNFLMVCEMIIMVPLL